MEAILAVLEAILGVLEAILAVLEGELSCQAVSVAPLRVYMRSSGDSV